MNTARWSDAPAETPSPATRPAVDAAPSTLRGLVWLGLIALAFSIVRAGWHRAFIPHWWKQW